jgi:hypothetical protein
MLAGAGAAASSSLRPGAGGQGGYDRVQRSPQGKQLKHLIILLYNGVSGPDSAPFRFYCKWGLGRFRNALNS